MIAGRTDMYGKVHDTICSSSNAPNYSSCYCDIIERTEQRALRQAREAVAGGFTTLANDPFISPEGRKEVYHYLTGAIEEIDALKGEQT